MDLKNSAYKAEFFNYYYFFKKAFKLKNTMKVLIVDERIDERCERALMKEGFFLLKLPADKRLGDGVCSHPDTLLFYSDGQIITTAEYAEDALYFFTDIREYSPSTRLRFTDEKRGDKYPTDCIMNALVIGRRIFCKADTVSEGIREYAAKHGYELIHTRQGYPACSVLAFGNAAITADEGLALLLEKYGVRVTRISQGGISLPPHQYGFIGGASGVVGDKIYFFGNIAVHPDGERICEAIRDEGFTPISLCNEKLTDLGGIIALQ